MSLQSQRGAILPLTLILLVVLVALVSAVLAIGVAEPRIAANFLRGNQAFGLAEAGAERAFGQFVADPTPVNSACSPTCGKPVTLWSDAKLQNIGTYTVTYQPIAFAAVLTTSTGQTTGTDKGQRTVLVVVTTEFTSEFAILSRKAEIGGNGKVKGTIGAVHGNDSVELDGSASIEKTATSHGKECDGCTDADHVGVPEASGPNKPEQTIPTTSPLAFLPKADFVFGDGKTVVNGVTVPEKQVLIVATGQLVKEGDAPFQGWKMHGAGEWQFSGGVTPPNGTFYASKEIKVTASPGTAEAPWQATLVAGNAKEEGKVEIEGNPTIKSYLDDVLVVAGESEMKGSASLTGAVLATSLGDHLGEVKMEGNVNLIGNIVATGEVELKGKATVIYNSKTRTRLLGPPRIVSWTTVSQ